MGIFSFLFGGKYPSTQKYEASLLKHAADYERFKSIASSAQLARYYELSEQLSQSEFKQRVEKLKTEKFSHTDAYRKMCDYNSMKKAADIKTYYSAKKQGIAQKLQAASASADYNRFLELQALVNSPEFRSKMTAKDFKKSEEAKLYKEFKKVSKSSNVKTVSKIAPSAIYKTFQSLDGSDRIKTYEELEAYVNSAEFINFKKEMEDKNRFKKSQEYQLIKEHESLHNDKEISWYLKSLEADAFADIKKWTLTFEDNFDAMKLDESKWITAYYWGQAMAGGTYATPDELQLFKPSNVAVGNSEARLVTRNEQTEGRRWTTTLGFVTDKFDYTSGMINTGCCFRQQYGRFDFKVKMTSSKAVSHNIWMLGEKNIPQINIASLGKKKDKFTIGLVTKDGAKSESIDGATFADKYYIYSLMWTPEKLVWYVNGVEVYTYKGTIPQEPMYILLSSHMKSDAMPEKEMSKPVNAEMAIDWVRCYTWAK